MRNAIIGFVIIFIIGVAIAYNMIDEEKELEFFNPIEINEDLVDESLRNKLSGHRIGDFTLTNQYGETISEADFENKIYVADFFFTTCPGICKSMVAQMMRVQEANKDAKDFRILSHTVQPEVDNPEVLLEYAELHNANPNIWQFATGERSIINDLARKSYFAAQLDEEDTDAMVHTENFVLVDKEKRIRGIYDGTSEEEVDQLIADIEILRKSYE